MLQITQIHGCHCTFSCTAFVTFIVLILMCCRMMELDNHIEKFLEEFLDIALAMTEEEFREIVSI